MSVVFVQYGDYRKTVQDFALGRGETYYAQRYSVDAVAQLREQVEDVVVVCVASGPYDERLENGVRAVGIPPCRGRPDERRLIGLLRGEAPSEVVMRTPLYDTLEETVRLGVRTLPLFANSFHFKLHQVSYHWRLGRLLDRPHFEWVCSHNLLASRSLVRIGVSPEKVIPWDWPEACRPEDHALKCLRRNASTVSLFYAGALDKNKGIGDVLRAVEALHGRGIRVALKIAGPGEAEWLRSIVAKLGIGEFVELLGCLQHDEVLRTMRDSDVVVVPSRHRSPEGLPMVIYESFASRTPVIVSSHRSFRGRVEHGVTGRVFKAGDYRDLARQIEGLLSSPEEYRRYSEAGPQAYHRLHCPAKWADVLRKWLLNHEENREWLQSYALATNRYD